MQNLIRAAIELGIANHEKTVDQIFTPTSREETTSLFILKAKNKTKMALDTLRGHYACLLLDASTDISQSCLDIVVSHPSLHPHSIVIDSLDNFGGLTEDYREVVSRIVHELEEQGIKIAGITTDNLKAQVQAVNPRERSSFQFQSLQASDKRIIGYRASAMFLL